MFFQRGCVRSTADYSIIADGSVLVVHSCQKNGKVKQVKGTAEVVDEVECGARGPVQRVVPGLHPKGPGTGRTARSSLTLLSCTVL